MYPVKIFQDKSKNAKTKNKPESDKTEEQNLEDTQGPMVPHRKQEQGIYKKARTEVK